MGTNHQQEVLRILRQAGEQAEDALNLFEIALAFGALEKPNLHLSPYRAHAQDLVRQVEKQGYAATLEDKLRLLREVFVTQNAYQGEEAVGADFADEDVRAVNLIDVIERRQGHGLALGILYLHVAQEVGWSLTPIDYAGRFFLRLACGGDQCVIDPALGCKICTPEMLRALHADDRGSDSDFDQDRPFALSADYIAVLDKRELLLRLQNNLKRRFLGKDNLDNAISTLQAMILVAPRNQKLWRELGYLQSERGTLRAAITALEVVCDLAEESAETQSKLHELRRRLN